MLTISNNLNLTQLQQLSNQSLLTSLRVGQVLEATAEPIKGDLVSLRIGQTQLTAQIANQEVPRGAIKLVVQQTQPTLQLALQPVTKTTSTQQTLQNALRLNIANQLPLTQVTQQFTQLLNQLPSQLQAPLLTLIQEMNKSLSSSKSATELKDRLNNSGLFLESKLANPTTNSDKIKHDLKALLLQFKQLATQESVKQTSATQLAAKLSDQAISKITFNQLQLYENPAIFSFQFANQYSEKPTDYLAFQKRQNKDTSNWEVQVNIHSALGEIKSKLSFSEDEKLFCGIWCESSILEQNVRDQMEILEQQLKSIPLDNLTITVLKQEPEQSAQLKKSQLIDIQI